NALARGGDGDVDAELDVAGLGAEVLLDLTLLDLLDLHPVARRLCGLADAMDGGAVRREIWLRQGQGCGGRLRHRRSVRSRARGVPIAAAQQHRPAADQHELGWGRGGRTHPEALLRPLTRAWRIRKRHGPPLARSLLAPGGL